MTFHEVLFLTETEFWSNNPAGFVAHASEYSVVCCNILTYFTTQSKH